MQNNAILNNIKAQYNPKGLAHALQENKKKHIAEYASALEVYGRDLDKAWTEFQKVVKRASRTKDTAALQSPYFALVGLIKPVNLKEKYDHYIAIFESIQDTEVEMTLDQANAIINDEWDWAVSAKSINSTYSVRNF